MHWEFKEEPEPAREPEEVKLALRDGGVLECGQQEILRHLGRAFRITLQSRYRFNM